MRIEGDNGVGNQELSGIKPLGASQPRPADVGSVGNSAGLSPAKQAHVQNALASDEVNTTAVAEATRLLQEGLLDTPQAARRTAEILLDRGP